MIKLTVRTMAQYLVSDEAERVRLLQESKYHDSDSVARARFYSEARTSISAFHRGAVSREVIEARIASMRHDARQANLFARAELLNNAAVLERYMYYQGRRELALAPPLAADLVRGDIKITVRPSLFAIEDDDERRLIFLELRERSSPPMLQVIAELAFEAFRSVLYNLPPRAIQVIDVRRGFIHELQQAGSAIGRELGEACREISEVWPDVPPPRGAAQSARPTERQMSIAWDFES